MKKFCIFTALAVAMAWSGFAFAADAGNAPVAYVTVGKAVDTDDVITKRYTGHVIAAAAVNVVSRVSGELLRVGFHDGEIVKKRQLLYELDPIRYEAEVKNIEAKIAENKARLAYAELSFKRNSELYAKNATTKDAVDSAESEHNAYKAALLAAEAQLITAKDDLENTKIVAPIDGKISISRYTVGNYLTPSSDILATIVQLDPLRVSFSMSNRDFLSMFGSEKALKQHALLRLKLADDSIYPYTGTVEFIDNQANLRTDTVQAYASFRNPEGVLVPGSTVTVLLERNNEKKALAVAPSAIMHDSKGPYVYVVDGENKVERRDVVLGQSTSGLQVVTSGLRLGEHIVTDGMHKTMPGAVIEPDYQG